VKRSKNNSNRPASPDDPDKQPVPGRKWFEVEIHMKFGSRVLDGEIRFGKANGPQG